MAGIELGVGPAVCGAPLVSISLSTWSICSIELLTIGNRDSDRYLLCFIPPLDRINVRIYSDFFEASVV